MTDEETWILRDKYNGQKCEAFLADVKRLNGGEPLGYIIGYVPFLDTKIFLDSKPLIPRSETEFWTHTVIQDIETKAPHILDLCAGSGCIGIALAKHFDHALVEFAEIEQTHHKTIRRNLEENGIDSTTVPIYGGSLFEEIPTTKQYDLIVSNPPYIDPALDRTESSVRNFEPQVALYGGERGLVLIEQIIAESPQHLTVGGVLYIEHEPEHVEDIERLGATFGFTVEVHPDQYGVKRYSKLTYTSSL
ncbi:peptide chain release factor N(5)-glutamine methyltransferase [Candidatus Parcubacteria bacterium]|uniref:peptide chain release factor N(5)-glutamine methyltransferase n=1 Tax=Candidatus Kaiserbacteria bacterium CG10_big_fil_rev_8_21_14_0_10_47_16 TaxID=1974608 RepID=A0A2H0UDC6_9BACT|nr:peptide chain release factor N(5)-glutamine methyltransferase [Candidatus Parcubacteria bacterium]PIR84424.1 MAG: hypothetical protein COU16_02480 [Candidatus Kaiserbacteria bacterium CG10_big_fil_rev_8_21_14_0_10_47_16]